MNSHGRGRALLARLGIEIRSENAGEAFTACQHANCASSDACHVHLETGDWKCFSCGEGGKPYSLAMHTLGDKDAAIDALVDVGIFEPRKSSRERTGEHFDAVKTMARAKGCEAVSLEAYGASSPEGKSIVFFPLFDPKGEQCSHFRVDVLANSGEEQKDSLLKKGMTSKGKPAGVFLPIEAGSRDTARLPAAGEKWLIVEGVKDAAALHSLGFNAIGTCGVSLPPKFAPLLRGAEIVIVPDRDEPSIRGAERSARSLYGLVGSIRIATLPVEARPTGGLDVRDVLRMKGEDAVRGAIEGAELWEMRSTEEDGRVRICTKAFGLNSDPLRLVRSSIDAIKRQSETPRMFQRSGGLVRIGSDVVGENGKAQRITRIEEVTFRRLFSELVSAAAFYEDKGEKGEDPAPPPKHVVDTILGQDGSEWPHLRGLATGPIVKPNGEVWTAEGYDEDLALLRPHGLEIEVPREISVADARAARERLWRPFREFPFQDEASEWNALALILTPFLRHFYGGATPLAVLTSTNPGAGKSKVAELASLIFSGEPPTPVSMSRNDELQKQISNVMISGANFIFFDEIEGNLRSETLQQILTSKTYSGRILGHNDRGFRVENLATWAAAGNNISLGSEMRRRSYMIEFNQSQASKNDFEIQRVSKWVLDHRADLCRDALIICRGWIAAGKPAPENLPAMGSFEEWVDALGGIVRWLGGEVLANRERLETKHDTEQQEWRSFLERIDDADPKFSSEGLTIKAILQAIEDRELWWALPSKLAEKADRPRGFSQSMSLIFKKREGRTLGEDGMRVSSRRCPVFNQTLWKLETDRADAEAGEGAIGGEDDLPF